jgi:hypothetical protein
MDTIILRDQYKPFIALCTGQGNTRVGLYFEIFGFLFDIIDRFLVSWRSPSDVDIEEKHHER